MITIVIDTREKAPFSFSDAVRTEVKTLAVGDYSIAGLENQIVCERKSLSDLLSSLTHGRERFQRELKQLRAFRFACIIIEADWETLLKGDFLIPTSAFTFKQFARKQIQEGKPEPELIERDGNLYRRCNVSSNAVLGSLMAFFTKYRIAIMPVPDHAMAGVLCEKMLTLFADEIRRDAKKLAYGNQDALPPLRKGLVVDEKA
jgi:ERCC4-type nuclease